MEAGDCPTLNINTMRAISVKSYLNSDRNSVLEYTHFKYEICILKGPFYFNH